MKTSKPAVTSDISPWLTALVYPLGRHVVLPFYFGSIEVVGREHLPILPFETGLAIFTASGYWLVRPLSLATVAWITPCWYSSGCLGGDGMEY